MFEHFKAFFANSRNQNVMIFVVCFIILLSVLKHFGLYEAFTDATSAGTGSDTGKTTTGAGPGTGETTTGTGTTGTKVSTEIKPLTTL